MATSTFYVDSSGTTGYISEIQDLLDQINAALAAALAAQAAAEGASAAAIAAAADAVDALQACLDALGNIPNIDFILNGNGKLYLNNQGAYTSPLPSTVTNGFLKNLGGSITWESDTFDETLDYNNNSGDWTFKKNVYVQLGTDEEFKANGGNIIFGASNHLSGTPTANIINLNANYPTQDCFVRYNDDGSENIKFTTNGGFGIDNNYNGSTTRTLELGFTSGDKVQIQDVSGTSSCAVTTDTFTFGGNDVTTYNVATVNPATAGTAFTVTFSSPTVWIGPSNVNLTGTISSSTTGAVQGIIQKIYHGAGTEPTWPASWVRLGTGEYATSVTNIIYAEYARSGRVEYWITQEY